MSAKQKILKFLQKPEASGRNTCSVKQARHMFKVYCISGRICELRQEGYPIYTNVRIRNDGSKVFVYRMGKPSRGMKRSAKAKGIKLQKM